MNLEDTFLIANNFAINIAQGKVFSAEDCQMIIGYCNKYLEEKAKITGNNNLNIRESAISWIPINEETKQIISVIKMLCIDLNSKNWMFDLTGFTEPLQFTKYAKSGDHYDWHMDIGNGRLSLRKLSVVIQLSAPEDYEGGELQIKNTENFTATKEKGSIIIFPSYMQHRVTPIISGKRYSLVAWISGPPLR